MELNSPAADEIELSVFGRGYGEAICVHLGDAEWALVDSCLDPRTGAPAALSYLASIGVSPEQVRLVIATHWHDDHVQGIADVVRACATARVVCSAALRHEEIFAFVVSQEGAKGALGSGVDEFRALLRVCKDRNRPPLWAQSNLPLHPLPPGTEPRVVALSPSNDAFDRSLQRLIELATNQPSLVRRRIRSPEGPNGASIATSIQNGNVGMLLGADLETSPNQETGWDAVLTYSRPARRASAVKIPHHGSVNAHHDAMWSDLLEPDCLAILTPWIRGLKHLPTSGDLDRLKAHAKKLYLTALPKVKKASKSAELQRLIRRLHGVDLSELQGWGHVRARRQQAENDWRVELSGDAVVIGER